MKYILMILLTIFISGCGSKEVYIPGKPNETVKYCEIPKCELPTYFTVDYNSLDYWNEARKIKANGLMKDKYISCLEDSIQTCKEKQK